MNARHLQSKEVAPVQIAEESTADLCIFDKYRVRGKIKFQIDILFGTKPMDPSSGKSIIAAHSLDSSP